MLDESRREVNSMLKLVLTVSVLAILCTPTDHSGKWRGNKELQVWAVECDSGPQSYLSHRKRSITDEVMLCEEIDSVKHFTIRPGKVKVRVEL